jgi:hypothetical protein
MKKSESVLQAFSDEAALRDYLADNLEVIERGLEKLDKEAKLPSRQGAAGRLDILARDRFGNIVVIEVKRTDQAARQTLNEISKYIRLLTDVEGVSSDEIRCIIVSVDWHGLLEPFSFFVSEVNYTVEGYVPVSFDGGTLFIEKIFPLPMPTGPFFSPVSKIYSYLDKSARDEHRTQIQKRCGDISSIRAAVLYVDSGPSAKETYCRAVLMVWRVRPEDIADLELVIGRQIGSADNYWHTGWEPEEDALLWISESSLLGGILHEYEKIRWGTPEKYENIFSVSLLGELFRFGQIATSSVNTKERIVDLLTAIEASTAVGIVNAHEVNLKSTPKHKNRFESSKKIFLSFLSFCPEWQDSASDFLDEIPPNSNYEVRFFAGHAKHFFSRLVQAYRDSGMDPSYMRIEIYDDSGSPIAMEQGFLSWDRKSCPKDAKAEIENTHGTIALAAFDMFRRAPEEELENAYARHGILPCIFRVSMNGESFKFVPTPGWSGTEYNENALAVFASHNVGYVNKVANLIEGFNEIRIRPTGNGRMALTKLSRNDFEVLYKRRGFKRL